MLAMATGAFAEKLTQAPVDFEIYGSLNSLYKSQTSYRAGLLDSQDRFEAAGFEGAGNAYRDGANNRASQNVRAKGALTMVAKAGENDYEGTKWYNMISVMILKMDANDPDEEDGESLDGHGGDVVSLGDVWVRYAPFAFLGIKVGTQTVAGTAPAAATGYQFAGDPDGDFVYYTVSVVDEKPGVTFDLHLSKDIEFGFGMLQGMGDFSSIVSGGKSEEATNTVFWFNGNFGFLEANLGYQSVSVGGSEDEGGIPKNWKHEYTHTMMNYMLKLNIGGFSPYYTAQQASGEKVSANVYAGLNTALTAAGLTTLNNNTSGNEVEGLFQTVGIIVDLEDWGKVAADYTMIGDAKWGEEKSLTVGTEAATCSHFNWKYQITDSSNITFFYNHLGTRDDDKLREDIQTMQNNVATAKALGLDQTSPSTYQGLVQTQTLLESIPFSSTQSIGIELSMTFGN